MESTLEQADVLSHPVCSSLLSARTMSAGGGLALVCYQFPGSFASSFTTTSETSQYLGLNRRRQHLVEKNNPSTMKAWGGCSDGPWCLFYRVLHFDQIRLFKRQWGLLTARRRGVTIRGSGKRGWIQAGCRCRGRCAALRASPTAGDFRYLPLHQSATIKINNHILPRPRSFPVPSPCHPAAIGTNSAPKPLMQSLRWGLSGQTSPTASADPTAPGKLSAASSALLSVCPSQTRPERLHLRHRLQHECL